MRTLAYAMILPLLVGGCLNVGCRSDHARESDPLMYSRAFQQAGFQDVQFCVMGGDGNVAGQTYNLTGLHWSVIGRANPSEVTVERLQAFLPRGWKIVPADPNEAAMP